MSLTPTGSELLKRLRALKISESEIGTRDKTLKMKKLWGRLVDKDYYVLIYV
jgi:hypothetical protein